MHVHVGVRLYVKVVKQTSIFFCHFNFAIYIMIVVSYAKSSSLKNYIKKNPENNTYLRV